MEYTDGFITQINIKNNEYGAILLRESLPTGMVHSFKIWVNGGIAHTIQERYDYLSLLSILKDALKNQIKVRIGHDPTGSTIKHLIISIDRSEFGPYLVGPIVRSIEESIPTFPR